MEQNNISEQENDLQTNEKKDNKKTDEKESTAKTILEYVISIGIAIVAALLINNFILLNAKVPSGSMENTIMTGDRLFGFRLSYLMEDPKRGDIVIFKYPDNHSIKRGLFEGGMGYCKRWYAVSGSRGLLFYDG